MIFIFLRLAVSELFISLPSKGIEKVQVGNACSKPCVGNVM